MKNIMIAYAPQRVVQKWIKLRSLLAIKFGRRVTAAEIFEMMIDAKLEELDA